MAKYGSAAAWLLVDGRNMAAAKPQSLRYKMEAMTEPTHGIGDNWEENTPTGIAKAELAQDGAFYDTGSTNMHALFSGSIAASPTDTTRVVCIGVEGQTTGNRFVGFEGVWNQSYEVIATNGSLTKANATYLVTGAAEPGTILHELSTETVNVATSDASLDHSAELQRIVQITSNTASTETKTIVCDSAHGLTDGETVVIVDTSGNSPSINGEHVVTIVDATSFTISTSDTGTSGTGGSFTKGLTVGGGAGYLQGTALSLDLSGSATVVVRDSTDNSTFADLCTFTASTDIGAERVAVTGEVQRYLAHSLTFAAATSGSPSIEYFVGFSRI